MYIYIYIYTNIQYIYIYRERENTNNVGKPGMILARDGNIGAESASAVDTCGLISSHGL